MSNQLSLKTVLMLGSAAAVIALCGPAAAQDFAVPSGDLKHALDVYRAQTGVPLVVSSEAIKGVQSAGAKGDLSPDSALSRILSGTGFTAHRDPSGIVAVVRENSSSLDVQPMQLAQAAPPRAAVETVTVTSSKLGGADVQSIPIAITALSQEQLTSTQTAGGPDLIKQVPNLTFTKTNFTGYSINIRGIGTQAISVTTDPAVAVAFNDTPFIRNHFFEQEFFDVSQVEVLRGPQGTLYGRNATAGVVNVTSARPTDQFEAMGSADIGNYKNRRFEAMLNLPIVSDKVDLRVAGEWTKRDGYSFNSLTDSPIDGRDLWSGRASLRWKPVESVTADFIWEHFSEDDDRLRSSKQLCKRDNGPATILGQSTAVGSDKQLGVEFLGQGCVPTSMYSPEAFGVPNALSLPYYGGFVGAGFGVSVVNPLGAFPGTSRDPYASTTQSTDLRNIESTLDPKYKARNDTLELNTEWNVTPFLTVNSATGYNRDFLWSTEDYNRFNTQPGIFAYNPADPNSLTSPDGNYRCSDGTLSIGGNNCATQPTRAVPTGYFCDPQLGCSNRLVGEDLSEEHSWQLSQELRLASNFKGPFNFSLGGNYMHYETEENYYVFVNTLTMYAAVDGLFGRKEPWVPFVSDNAQCVPNGHQLADPKIPTSPESCLGYIDPNLLTELNNQGHNYFLSQNPYNLNSYAMFGEAYYDVTENLKLTGGLRWTDDQKHFVEIPSELLTLGYGYPSIGNIDQEWKEWTGRFVANWTPQLSFTGQTMIYASYAHGYKAGGANPPGAVLLVYDGGDINNPTHPQTFKPEFNDAFELGTKNTALDGSLVLNADVFYYDYKGYQISQIVDRTSVNLNFDATVKGAEIQATWSPLPGLKFGFNGGYEDTRLANGSKAIDLMDRTAGNPDWVLVKPFPTQASNCVLPAYVVAYEINPSYGNNSYGIPSACGQAYNAYNDPVTARTYVANPTGKTIQGRPLDPSYPGFDPLAGTAADPYTGQNTFNGVDYGPAPNNGAGFYKDLSGNQLPNAPHYTASFTADYTMPVSPDWAATLHTDFYWQSQSWARVFNAVNDEIHGYSTVNLALILNDASGWQIMGYVKNVFDKTAITGTFLNSDDSGLTTNVFLTDPRLFGVRITKHFDGTSNGGSESGFLADTDGKRPQMWLQLGGNFAQLANDWQPYVPPFISSVPAGLPSPLAVEKGPRAGFDWEGKLSIQPANSDWVLKAGVRYGRSAKHGTVHKSLPPSHGDIPITGSVCSLFGLCSLTQTADVNKLVDASASVSEQHTMLDFTLGKDVGIGMFGPTGASTISAGVRMVQLSTRVSADINTNPNWILTLIPPFNVTTAHDVLDGTTQENRSFHGIGPEVTWDADEAVFGTFGTGQLTVDWGVNAALLLGQQRVDLRQETSDRYCSGGSAFNILCTTTAAPPNSISRSRRVAVPNLGGYVGASMRYSNARISLGYRADTFFNATDGGQETAKSFNRGFYGPYLNVSIGLGG